MEGFSELLVTPMSGISKQSAWKKVYSPFVVFTLHFSRCLVYPMQNPSAPPEAPTLQFGNHCCKWTSAVCELTNPDSWLYNKQCGESYTVCVLRKQYLLVSPVWRFVTVYVMIFLFLFFTLFYIAVMNQTNFWRFCVCITTWVQLIC